MSSPPPSPPPPVSSLRSRFEQLAAGSASHNHKPRASIAHELGRGRPGPPVVPRRVVSASHSPAPSEHETTPTPTPTRSALLSRPVPTPPVASTSGSSNTQLSPGLPSLPVRPAFNSAPPTIESEPPSGGVASLRSKFAGAGPGSSIERASSPRPPPSPSKRDWQRPASPVASTSGQHKPPPIPDRLTRPPRIAVSRPQPSESSAHEQPPSPSPPPLPSRSRPTSTHVTGDSDSGHSLNGDLWSRSSSETSSSSSSSSTCDDPQQCSNNNHERGPPPPVPARPGTGSTGSLSVHPPPLPVRRQGSTSSGSPTSDTPPPMLPSRSPQLAPPPPLPSRPGGGAPNSPSPSLPPRPSTPNPPQNKIATVATTPTPKGPPSPLPPPRPSATMPPPARPHLAPPPTRIIAPGAPLPTRRTSPGGSSSDSEDDAELAPSPSTRTSHMPYRRKTLDDMPDASSASRRPPLLHSAALHVPAHTGVVAVAGHTVLIASSTIRIFDLSGEESAYSDATLPPHMAPAPVITLDVRDLGLEWRSKEHRVTSAEFRPALEGEEEEGRYVWLGTRDGHLLELDAWTGRVVDVRSAIHSGAVVHILLGEREMVTVDENGKALRWAGARGKGGAGVLRQSARLVRLPERTGFVGVHAGWMWAASAAGGGGTPAGSNSNLNLGSTLKKGFASATSVDNVSGGGQWTLRAYDLRSGGAAACAVLPTHDVGAVTCGATLPAQPGVVFLGHEGGVVSLWDCTTSPSPTSTSSPDGGRSAPVCVQTLKIGAGDVLALAGVGARLWAGGRSGYIAAYDVGARPWRATNVWKAHGELPVLRLGVDVVGIAKTGRVGVWSVGRDECVRFWDGLLGGEWVEGQLLQRERHFCTYRALRTLICTWNVDAARPDGLTGSPANVTFLENLLQSVETPDVIVFGFQELIDLESRKLTAKNVLLGGNKKKADGSISSKVSRSYKLWHDALVLAMRVAMPATCPYTVVHTENLVGLFTCIFVKSTEVASLRDVAVSTVKRGLGGRYGNKGAIAARFVIDDSSVCFVNCHLAAGQKHVKTRNADVAAILEDRAAFSPSEGSDTRWDVSYVGGGDGSMILDHEICFLNGDLNYRIDQRREAVMSYVRGGDYDFLLQHDQLLKELAGNPYFRLRVFREAARIAFAPTYKYDRRSDAYDTSEKRRAPAWCDRVLVRAREPERVRCLEGSYRRWEVDVSDHRPVSAAFEMTVKKVDWARRERERKEVLRDWDRVAGAMLREAREWYAQQGAIWLA